MSEHDDTPTPSISAQKRKERIRALVEADKAALKSAMGRPEGRRTLWRVLETSGFFSISFTGNSETFFREGKRSVGKALYDELQALCPDLYDLMVNENRRKEQGNA